eukprot:743491-Rhodomonas_salina.1
MCRPSLENFTSLMLEMICNRHRPKTRPLVRNYAVTQKRRRWSETMPLFQSLEAERPAKSNAETTRQYCGAQCG